MPFYCVPPLVIPSYIFPSLPDLCAEDFTFTCVGKKRGLSNDLSSRYEGDSSQLSRSYFHYAESRRQLRVNADAERGAGDAGCSLRGSSPCPPAEDQSEEDTVHSSCPASPPLQKQGPEGADLLILIAMSAYRSSQRATFGPTVRSLVCLIVSALHTTDLPAMPFFGCIFDVARQTDNLEVIVTSRETHPIRIQLIDVLALVMLGPY